MRETGLCAPDIAMLEPLAEALDTTVTALITGEPEAPVAVEPVLEYSIAEVSRKNKHFMLKIIALLLALLLLLSTVNGLRGEGFVLRCVPAWICACQGARALKNYDEAAILRSFGGSEQMYAQLTALEDRGICILDANAEFTRVGLEDGLLMLEIELLVSYEDLEYRLTCPGTYQQGRVELMQIAVTNPPAWLADLSHTLATYYPG